MVDMLSDSEQVKMPGKSYGKSVNVSNSVSVNTYV
jgi:tRNA(Leu) C34 or U34 (ribose-2'-O)-methylase TrmL